MMHGLVVGGPPGGPGGIFSLRDPSELAALAKRQGFVEVNVEEIPITSHADSIEAHVARVSSLAGLLAAVFASASLEQLADVHRPPPSSRPSGFATAPPIWPASIRMSLS